VPQALFVENGDVVRLDRSGGAIVDEFPVGRLGSDGKSLLPIGGAVLQQRRRIAGDGSVVATLVVDRRGSLAAPPQVSLVGLAEATAEPAAALCSALADAMESLPTPMRHDDNALREAASRVLRRGLNQRFGKRPLIEVQLVRL
jgi:ribonuclease J